MLEMIFWKFFQFFKIIHAPRSKLDHNIYSQQMHDNQKTAVYKYMTLLHFSVW
jgi:hypothetical protein